MPLGSGGYGWVDHPPIAISGAGTHTLELGANRLSGVFRIDASAGDGAYTATVVMSAQNAVMGSFATVICLFPASANPRLQFRSNSVGGTLIEDVLGNQEPRLVSVRFAFDGAEWVRIGVSLGLTNEQLRGEPVPVEITNGSESGGLTDAQLRATPVEVEITNTLAVNSLSNTELRAAPVEVDIVDDPMGAAIRDRLPSTLGAKTGANSLSVVPASDAVFAVNTHAVTQSGAWTVSSAQSGTWNLTNISGTISLPTGASTAANQTTTNSNLGATNEAAASTDTATSGLNGLFKRLLQRITTLLDRIPTLGQKADSGGIPIVLSANQVLTAGGRFTPVTIGTVTTAATGTNWTTLTAAAGQVIDFRNTSAVDLEYRRGGAGNSIQVMSGTGRMIYLTANANEISVRRVDTSNTQVTVNYEVLS